MSKYEAINSYFGVIEFPMRLQEMEDVKMNFPKTERAFYEITLKALKKALKPTENIYSFEAVQPSLTKYGFLVLTSTELILSMHKGAIMPSASLERIPLNKIKDVDFDIIPLAVNPFNVNEGSIHLTVKKGFGTKKYTIRDVSTSNLDSLVKRIRSLVQLAQ